MSAASPAHNQVRRNAAAAPSRAPQPQAHAQAHAPVRQPAPRTSTVDLDVEGFKPSLLSRLFDLFAPIRRR